MIETAERDPIQGWELGKALMEAGIIGGDTQRVLIDVPADGLVKLYVQRIGSRKLLDIARLLRGAEIVTVDAEEV